MKRGTWETGDIWKELQDDGFAPEIPGTGGTGGDVWRTKSFKYQMTHCRSSGFQVNITGCFSSVRGEMGCVCTYLCVRVRAHVCAQNLQ